jgi:Zn-finger protein
VEDASFYLSNKDCRYFPCHQTEAEGFNCLFCYCPLYYCADCPGSPEYLEVKGNVVKDCSRCDFPHRPENYERVIEYIAARLFRCEGEEKGRFL